MKFRILFTCLLMLSIAFAAQAEKKQLTKTVSYELTPDGTLTFEGTGEIPDVKYKTSYFKTKFKGKHIRKIIFGEGITRIGSFAFQEYPFRESDPKIEVAFPSTLKEVSTYAFYRTPLQISTPFSNAISIYYNAFSDCGLTGTLEIPENSLISDSAFNNNMLDTLIVNGYVILGNAFNSSYGSESTLKHVELRGQRAAHIDLWALQSSSLKSIYVESDEYTKNDNALLKHLTLPAGVEISTAETRLRQAGVTAYVEGTMPSWEKFLEQHLEKQSLMSPAEAKTAIEQHVEQWQKKGEFETTAEWQKRVNEASRNALVKKLSNEYNTKLTAAVEKAKTDYAALRKAKAKDYFDQMSYENIVAYKRSPLTLHPYDADNQTFMITSEKMGDILLRVPRNEASAFKANWTYIAEDVDYEFVPISESEVGLKKVTFTDYQGLSKKTYVYDGKSDVNYTITDVNYNFTPLKVSGELANISIADISAPEAGTTVTTGNAIQKREADVQRRTITAGSGAQASAPSATKSTLDSNIPAGTSPLRTNTFALIIANEDYNRTESVPYAVNDGVVLQNYMQKTLNIPAKNIFMVKNATLNDIRYNLKRLSDVCRAFDGDAELIVYYAGHGVPDEASHDAYLLPVDGYPDDARSGLSLNQLTNELAELPSKRSMLLLDACFSGAGRQGDMLTQARGVAIKAKPTAGKGNLIVFAASQGVETAQPLHSEGHGMFTYFLLKKLNESRGNVTLGELSDYVISNVKRASAIEGKMQTPTISAESAGWTSQKF